MGAYSRWALIRGWALIRINTVTYNFIFSGVGWSYFLLAGADYPDPGNRLLLLAITQSHFPLNTQASHVDVLRLSFGPLSGPYSTLTFEALSFAVNHSLLSHNNNPKSFKVNYFLLDLTRGRLLKGKENG